MYRPTRFRCNASGALSNNWQIICSCDEQSTIRRYVTSRDRCFGERATEQIPKFVEMTELLEHVVDIDCMSYIIMSEIWTVWRTRHHAIRYRTLFVRPKCQRWQQKFQPMQQQLTWRRCQKDAIYYLIQHAVANIRHKLFLIKTFCLYTVITNMHETQSEFF